MTPDSLESLRDLSTIPDDSPSPEHGRDRPADRVTHLVTPDAALRDILDDASAASAAFGFGYRQLWRTLADATDGGKRFRSSLLTTSYRAWGGTDMTASASVGAAIELLHTAFVVHDDVIDGDDTRRGRLNVSGAHAAQARASGVAEHRAREYGAAAGILAGDLALAAALRTVACCPVPRATVLRLLDLFDQALHTSAAGELADVWMSLGADHPALPEILSAEERKTGAYSFTLPLQAGAALAGASEHAVECAGDVGRFLGIAFQLVDDHLGVFGDPSRTGKSVLSDLRTGKQTPLVAHARTTSLWPDIKPYVGRADLSEAEAARARALLTTSGSRSFVVGLAADYAERALFRSRETGMPPSLVAWIARMTAELGKAVS
ncbi:MAG TPA: polyprenyl synthetase family protein [Nocardioidaceae bacterium]|nr:polyprenyl synthetase family protein [Nocardioidaceae bacterium]